MQLNSDHIYIQISLSFYNGILPVLPLPNREFMIRRQGAPADGEASLLQGEGLQMQTDHKLDMIFLKFVLKGQ